MTSFDTITSTTPAQSQTPAARKADGLGSATLGKDDFLKLLMVQLQHQDPMSPMDNTEYMGQLAQFSTLEQISNVGEEMKRLRASSQVDQAVSLIGKTVGYTLLGSPGSGVVDSVSIVEGEIHLKLGAVDITPAAITSVAPGSTP